MRSTSSPITGAARLLLPAVAATMFLLLPAAGGAKTSLVELRVEGAKNSLDPGTWYVTGTERVKRGLGDDCDPRSGRTRYPGPNALGLLESAARWNPKLRPVRARTTDLGPQVCQVGKLKSYGHYPNPSGGFLYWTDFVSGFSSPDVASLDSGQSLLWYYARFPSDPPQIGDPVANTGLALELKGVPARDADGEFVARVVAHDYDGTPQPAPGAAIAGAGSVQDLGDGRYEVTVGHGTSTLRATRSIDVASNQVDVCFKARIAACPRAHGRTIRGSRRSDRLRGTRGFDDIAAAGGADVIDLRAGGRDRADCGRGDDAVLVDRGDSDDRIGADCERVRRS
jgi:hypothetical protein